MKANWEFTVIPLNICRGTHEQTLGFEVSETMNHGTVFFTVKTMHAKSFEKVYKTGDRSADVVVSSMIDVPRSEVKKCLLYCISLSVVIFWQ